VTNILVNAPKTARKGEVVELKALILHPMETGFRPGTNGRLIPRNIIERFVATWNGAEIFSMDLSPAISANPFVSFFAVATESGRIGFRWTGDEGFAVEETVTIEVA
jgi:sulfur-oxidizing protein SoxZ